MFQPLSIRCSILALLTVLSACGCSNLTPRQCLQEDWYLAGERAAAAGQPVTQFMAYQRQCSLHGINPDRWDFVLGWRAAGRAESS